MAQRRMFSAQIVTSDEFLEMPLSSQGLYFHLGMSADDDGFVTPRKILRMIGASEDDFKLLVYKKFVIPFENGVIVITHWKQNNYLRNDRYTPSIYKTERDRLSCIQGVYHLDAVGIPEVSQLDTQEGRKGVRKEEKSISFKKNEDTLSPRHIKRQLQQTRSALEQKGILRPHSR